MNKLRFPMTTDQLELLLAFEESGGLGPLARMVAKDPSVVSRNLQRIAEEFPVIQKSRGRWEITSLGRQLNQQTRIFLKQQLELLKPTRHANEGQLGSLQRTALIIINAQKGLLDRISDERNNWSAEENIALLRDEWRKTGRPVVFVRHISDNPASSFFRGSVGAELVDQLQPLDKEPVLDKSSSSAFKNTPLKDILSRLNIEGVVLAGYTSNECISESAKDATGLGFDCIVVEDATATFDIRDHSGKLMKADLVHRLTLANIHALYGKVSATKDLLFRGSM